RYSIHCRVDRQIQLSNRLDCRSGPVRCALPLASDRRTLHASGSKRSGSARTRQVAGMDETGFERHPRQLTFQSYSELSANSATTDSPSWGVWFGEMAH